MSYFETFQGNWSLEEVVKAIEISTERYNVKVTYPEYILSGQSLNIFNAIIFGEITDYVANFTDSAEQLVLPGRVKAELIGRHFTYTAIERYITVKFDFYTYLGGAHPDRNILTITFDTAANIKITLSDLFVTGSNYLERLSILAEKALFEKYPELDFAFNNATYRRGFAAEEGNFSHWALTDSGLIIFFPVYQVAPYAAGTLDIEIPYAAITDIAVYTI